MSSTVTRLESFLHQNGIRPLHLATCAGVSRQQLQRLRYGRAEARRPTIVKLARACGLLLRRKVGVSELFDLGEE